MAVNIRLARDLGEQDPAAARAVLEQLSGDVRVALEEVRSLAHGIYPPLLLDRGLVEALAAAVARAPCPARFEPGSVGRYSPDVEAAVYFCCLEALQNVAKHAGEGARATVRLVEIEGGLRFEVTDGGAGFEVTAAMRGAGLTGMADRLGAAGGRLTIDSSPGRGTVLTGTIPLADAG